MFRIFRSIAAVVTVAAFTCAGVRADETNGKDLFLTALKNTQGSEAFKVKVNMEVTLGEGMQPMGISAEGWIKKDLNYFKMNGFGGMETEAYNRNGKSCRRDAVTGEWVIEEGDEGDLGGQRLQNPLEYIKAFESYADKATIEPDGEITQGTEKVACRVIKMHPPAEALKGFLSGMGLPDAAVDWQKAKLELHAWIAKDKTVFRRLVADVQLEIAGLQMPGAEGDDEESVDSGPGGGGGKKDKKDKKHRDDAKDGVKAGGGDAPGAAPTDENKGGPKGDDPKAAGAKPDAEPSAEPGDPEMPEAPSMKLMPKATFEMYDYDKDPAGEIPKEVKTKLGIQ
ncbi:MAG: hypothetical protein HZA54_16150 [Planctomycetes bacterium]|nr:hypothetical protein [Planctomycetota bacterium]